MFNWIKNILKSNKNNTNISTTNLRGVYKTKSGKFSSRIRKGGKQEFLGTFTNANEAHMAYVTRYIQLYGHAPRSYNKKDKNK